MSLRARALLAGAVAALATAGCSGDGSGAPTGSGTHAESPQQHAPQEQQRPRPFRAAEDATPAGATVVQCSDLRVEHATGLAVRFALPAGLVGSTRDGGGCGFTGGSYDRALDVSFGPMESLERLKERELDPFEDTGGDDSVSDIAYAAHVPVFGTHRGERLTYYCYCDGQDLDEQVVQARGVRVHWTTPHRKDSRTEDLDALLTSTALVRSTASTCTGRGRTATFRPPIPQTESIDLARGRCHLYLRPGRASLQRYAEVVPAPTRSLGEIASSLRDRPRVSDVRLVGGRLTWRWTRDHTGEYGAPAGTWRAVTVAEPGLQVTWSATPRQWRREADVVRRFVDSVRLRPRG